MVPWYFCCLRTLYLSSFCLNPGTLDLHFPCKVAYCEARESVCKENEIVCENPVDDLPNQEKNQYTADCLLIEQQPFILERLGSDLLPMRIVAQADWRILYTPCPEMSSWLKKGVELRDQVWNEINGNVKNWTLLLKYCESKIKKITWIGHFEIHNKCNKDDV